MRILIQFPTRGRKDTFFRVIKGYYDLATNIDLCLFHVVIDKDDASMNNVEVIARLDAMKNCIHSISSSKGKIQAINTMPNVEEWDIVLLASDDMIAQKKGWDDDIRSKMKMYYPDTDGVLWYNDGYVKNRLNTLVCAGRKYYNRFRYIYHPSYKSLWCDNEFTDVANSLGRQAYFSECIIRHEHPINTNSKKRDQLYIDNEKLFLVDCKNYEQRKKLSFPFDVLLSIMICTIPKRSASLDALVKKLGDQIREENAIKLVEILYCDDPNITIGHKRNLLVEKASGEYMCFIDDDDDIPDNYVRLILSALNSKPDCLTLNGIITTNGKSPKKFVHSLKYNSYFTKENVYYRPPNHLNVIKKSLVRQFKFPEKNFSEDTDWAMTVCKAGVLKTEVDIPQTIYFYKFMTKK